MPKPKVRKEWRKKEEERQAWHEMSEKKELNKIPEEKVKEEEPLKKGTHTDGTEPLEKGEKSQGSGDAAASAAPAAAAASAASAATAAPAASAAPTAAASAAPAAAATAAPAAASGAPLQKGTITTEQGSGAKPLGKGKVMRTAMELLLGSGYEIVICSWCFSERKKEVLETLEKEEWFPQVTFTSTEERTGAGGKADLCQRFGCTTIFDDGIDILKECHHQGIQVYPIRKPKAEYDWFSDHGLPVYPSLADAVEKFLGGGK
eukprot:s443_g24.t1